ncbi:MAG TPA: FAA hydrolase family protein [Epsilonproteobacteria bacterium]|nr:FAA hydrolase family protein [Campylobacterota bacterium]
MKSIHFNNQTIVPSKVICVGRNYVEHIKELNNETPDSMVLFNKPNSAITDTLHFIQDDCRFEGEICFLIKDKQIEGIGFGLDLTKAGIQNKMKEKGLPWERAKGFDGSAVLSKFVKFSGDIQTIEMKLFINGALAQHATYDLMIYKPDNILSEIQTFMSLEDGDIIMSGTPKGVATYSRHDVFLAVIYVDGKIVVKEEFIAF